MSICILALDTATEACSAALMIDDELLLEHYIVAPCQHTQHILPMIDRLLAEAGITLDNLDTLAFSQGPGSFTGVRIGISIAQGLALGADLPLIGISTLAALAEGAWRQTGASQVLTAIDARMGEIYWAAYRRNSGVWLSDEDEAVVSPVVLSKDLTGCWTTAGSGWQTYPTLLKNNKLRLITSGILFPSARDILSIALHRYIRGSTYPVALAEPTYLRNKVAWKNLPNMS